MKNQKKSIAHLIINHTNGFKVGIYSKNEYVNTGNLNILIGRHIALNHYSG